MESPEPPTKRRKSNPPSTSTSRRASRSRERSMPESRASYLSPTKASLSRFNPDILSSKQQTPRAAAQSPRLSTAPVTAEEDSLAYLLGEGHAMSGQEATAGAEEARAIAEGALSILLDNQGENQDMVQDVLMREPELDLPDNSDMVEAPDFAVEKPKGILFSSPRRRQKKSSASPTKLPSRDDIELTGQEPEETTVLSAERSLEVPEATETIEDLEDPKLSAEDEKALNTKLAERDALLKERDALEKEVQSLHHHIEMDHDTPAGQLYSDFNDAVSIIQSLPACRPATPGPLPLSSLLTSFLPFSIPLPTPTASESKSKPLPSHAPKDPTPAHLALFTPLTLTTSLSAPSVPTNPTDPVTQDHVVTLTAPFSLLSLTLNLRVSTTPTSPKEPPTVAALSTSDLSPWAVPVLGSWIKARAKDGDVAAIGYGVGRYWDLAARRARCWVRCGREFGELVDGGMIAEETSKRRSGKPTAAGLKRSAASVTEGSEDEEVNESFSRVEMARNLGRESIVLRNRDVVLRIVWKIELDWSGEGVSKVQARAAFPRIWHDVDDRSSLKKVPVIFDMLVRKLGVFQATKVLVGLMFEKRS